MILPHAPFQRAISNSATAQRVMGIDTKNLRMSVRLTLRSSNSRIALERSPPSRGRLPTMIGVSLICGRSPLTWGELAADITLAEGGDLSSPAYVP